MGAFVTPLVAYRRLFFPSGYVWIDADTAMSEQKQIEGIHSSGVVGYPVLVGRHRRISRRTLAQVGDLESEPELFKKLAAVEPTRDGVMGFVLQHGFLGIQTLPVTVRVKGEGQHPTGRVEVMGEELSTWVLEIRNLRAAVDIWTALSEEDTVKLRTLLAANGVGQSVDLLKAGRKRLTELTRNGLRANIRPDLRFDGIGSWSLGLEVIGVRPAAWLQFAHALVRAEKLYTCPVCSQWFEPSAAGLRADEERQGRSDRTYCSAKCKNTAKKRRQRGKNK